MTPPTLPTGIPPRSTLRRGSSSGTAPSPRLDLSTWPLFWLAENHLRLFLPPGDEEQAQRASAAPIQAPIPGPEQLFPPRMFYHTSSPSNPRPSPKPRREAAFPRTFRAGHPPPSDASHARPATSSKSHISQRNSSLPAFLGTYCLHPSRSCWHPPPPPRGAAAAAGPRMPAGRPGAVRQQGAARPACPP